jgi:hypothetical protein
VLSRVRIRIEVLLGPREVGKEAIVSPPLVLDFACLLMVVESISMDPAARVDDGAAREALDGAIVSRTAIQVLLEDRHVLPVEVGEVQECGRRRDMRMAGDIGAGFNEKDGQLRLALVEASTTPAVPPPSMMMSVMLAFPVTK